MNVEPSETLRLVWQSPDGRTEAVLAAYDVPSGVTQCADELPRPMQFPERGIAVSPDR